MSAILDLLGVDEPVLRWSVEDYEHLGELGLLPRQVELVQGIIVGKYDHQIFRWSVEEYERLTELALLPRRAELIRGVIYEKMSKSPLHSALTQEIWDALSSRVRAGLVVRQEKPLRLSNSMPEPDVAVVRGTKKEFYSRHPTTAELVAEVAVSSVPWDRQNALLYAEAHVTEYWIVLAEKRQVEVHRQPENGKYQQKRVYGAGELIECACLTGAAGPIESWFPM